MSNVEGIGGSEGNTSNPGVRVVQPLLKGGGLEINQISVEVARNQYEAVGPASLIRYRARRAP